MKYEVLDYKHSEIGIRFYDGFPVKDIIFEENTEIDDEILDSWKNGGKFEDSGHDIVRFGDVVVLFHSLGDQGCEVQNFADLSHIKKDLQLTKMCKLNEIQISPVDTDDGYYAEINGVTEDGKEINLYNFIPCYSVQNGYYSSGVRVVIIDNNEWTEAELFSNSAVEII